MKALSFRKPWAELVLQGRKTLDLRTYPTHYRGPLAIHASKTVEREACRRYGLDPDTLETGGIVGVVELVDVTPLTPTDYEERQAEHLAGRPSREGLHGWLLRRPRRLARLVPARGRMSLFNVDLTAAQLGLPDQSPGRVDAVETRSAGVEEQPETAIRSTPAPRPASLRPLPAHTPGLRAGARVPDPPFELLVKATSNGSVTTGYEMTLRQQILHPPEAQQTFYGAGPATMTDIVTLSGDGLRAVSDHVLDALRESGYKATDLSPQRRAPFRLPEAAGVRLALVFLAVKPLSKLDRIEAISHGIRHMTLEELYYWYSKCTATETADRAQKALRVLLAAE